MLAARRPIRYTWYTHNPGSKRAIQVEEEQGCLDTAHLYDPTFSTTHPVLLVFAVPSPDGCLNI